MASIADLCWSGLVLAQVPAGVTVSYELWQPSETCEEDLVHYIQCHYNEVLELSKPGNFYLVSCQELLA